MTRTKLGSTLRFALSSRRTLAVTCLSFASGLPIGLVWISIPDWMRDAGVDIRIVGLTTLAHAPWSFKMLWAPLLDRYPIPGMGRRRGWIAVTQVILILFTLLVGVVTQHPDTPWVVLALCFAIALASATQDIVIDAYAVDVLRPEEQGVAVGARIAVYRSAMYISGGLAISLLAWTSWKVVAITLALLYVPCLWLTRRSPEPEVAIPRPQSLREAVWLPFLGFLSRHRALEILAFVILYKLADNLAESLLRPFLVDMGYSNLDRGIGLTTIGTIMTLAGTLLGGALTSVWGLGHCLWIFGILQIFSNIGYVFVSESAVNLPLLYTAMGFENATKGMGMGAFGVLLIRMTQKRFSATQYALFSSLFVIPRLISGPVTGMMVYSIGWTPFFWFTMLMGVPGMLMLARFVPPGTRELPSLSVEPPRSRTPLTPAQLWVRATLGAVVGFALAVVAMAALTGLEPLRKGGEIEFLAPLLALLVPHTVSDVLRLVGAAVTGVLIGLLTAATFAARHGMGAEDTKDGPEIEPEAVRG
jgi:MFS transporter, PAT family, beta-lactamase induction signal transducer AmpG